MNTNRHEFFIDAGGFGPCGLMTTGRREVRCE